MSWFSCCVALVLIFQHLFQRTEAASSLPRDRVILSYNVEFDRCNRITDSSDRVEIDSADWACEEAFKALDDIGHNSCHGWRSARCRLLTGYKKPQCSCTISQCTQFEIRSDDTKTFRECASEIWTDEVFDGEAQPSERFREAWRRADISLAATRTLPASFNLRRSKPKKSSCDAAAPLGAGSSSSSGVGPQCDTVKSTPANTVKTKTKKQSTEELYCKLCKIPFSTRANLGRHLKNTHPGGEAGVLTKIKRGGPKIFECDLCGASYSEVRSLMEHLKTHLEDFECPACNKLFGNKGNLSRHIHQKHRDLEAEHKHKTGSKTYKRKKEEEFCYICKRKFASKWNLERHIEKRHSGEEAEAWGRDPNIKP